MVFGLGSSYRARWPEWLSFGLPGLLGFLCDRLQIFAQLPVCEPACAAEMFDVSLQGVWGSSLRNFLSIAMQRLLGSLACGTKANAKQCPQARPK